MNEQNTKRDQSPEVAGSTRSGLGAEGAITEVAAIQRKQGGSVSKAVSTYLKKIGSRGGKASKRELTSEQAKSMVEAKRAWKRAFDEKRGIMNVDPTRARFIRLDGQELSLPFTKSLGKVKVNINGVWHPLLMVGSVGHFVCGPMSFKRVYYPEASPVSSRGRFQ